MVICENGGSVVRGGMFVGRLWIVRWGLDYVGFRELYGGAWMY